MTNLDKYNQVFINVLSARPEDLNASFTFRDVPQWDSVAHLTLISELEDAFDIMFDAEDILHYESYENGKTILRRMGIEI